MPCRATTAVLGLYLRRPRGRRWCCSGGKFLPVFVCGPPLGPATSACVRLRARLSVTLPLPSSGTPSRLNGSTASPQTHPCHASHGRDGKARCSGRGGGHLPGQGPPLLANVPNLSLADVHCAGGQQHVVLHASHRFPATQLRLAPSRGPLGISSDAARDPDGPLRGPILSRLRARQPPAARGRFMLPPRPFDPVRLPNGPRPVAARRTTYHARRRQGRCASSSAKQHACWGRPPSSAERGGGYAPGGSLVRHKAGSWIYRMKLWPAAESLNGARGGRTASDSTSPRRASGTCLLLMGDRRPAVASG